MSRALSLKGLDWTGSWLSFGLKPQTGTELSTFALLRRYPHTHLLDSNILAPTLLPSVSVDRTPTESGVIRCLCLCD